VAENIVYFDLETQKSAEEVGGWENKRLMRFAFGVTYGTREGAFRGFEEEDVPALIRQLQEADRIIGFNLLNFDYAVLSAYTDVDFTALPTLDLLAYLRPLLGFRPKLEGLASATLGAGKSADGLASLRWFKEGEFAKIALYCREDVRITRDLHLFGREHRKVYYFDKQGIKKELTVDWL
jgi:DEAD/DEAH box helicase domain-containing protein